MRLLPLPGVFQPPSDSWMLASSLRRERVPDVARALDLCTGSGILAIAAARHGYRHVVATDISRRAVAAARLNGALNGVAVHGRRGDLFEPVASETFDLITANPPYLPTPDGELPQRGLERAWEGGRDGRAFLDRICAQVAEHLRPNGVLLLVHSSICGELRTVQTLRDQGLTVSIALRHRNALGPILSARAGWLARNGMLLRDGSEEILVIRAQAPGARDHDRAHRASDASVAAEVAGR